MGGPGAEKTMLTLIIFNEAAKKVDEIQVSALYSGAGKTLSLLEGGKVKPEHEKVIAQILSSGFASGDNEICAEGLVEMTKTVAKAIPKKGSFGMTHTLFLTDGGTSSGHRDHLTKTIQTLLDNNPLQSFDTVIVDKDRKTNFHEVQKKIKTRRMQQEPTLQECTNVSEICPAIVSALVKRIKTMKSFQPNKVQEAKRTIKKTGRKIDALIGDPS
jgi:hypothetical protein